MEGRSVEKTLLERRSIRRYERQPVSGEDMEFIYEAIRNTPTSYNGQQFTVIDVTDQDLKLKLYDLIGQKQIKTCSHFLAFCADYNRISIGAKAKGLDMPEFENTADGLIVGVVDASLAMMSAVVAAGSRGLGACCIGYARTAAPEDIARLLGLPDKVFVVCGLAIGVPRELPDLKPKMPSSLLIHSNGYDMAAMQQGVLSYDEQIKEYNAVRSGATTDNDWVGHILDYYREAMGYGMLQAVKRRGFDIKS